MEQIARTWSHYRWWICGLLFLATTINYVDRQVVGVLKNTLMQDLHWDEQDFATVVFWFQAAYAAGYLFAGRLMDLIGVRKGYAFAVVAWSLAAIGHAFARTVFGFSVARAALGLSEGGNFPAAVKTVSEWFPKKERALATGIFNAGSNLGPIVTPILVPWITLSHGWPAAFAITGALGFFWLIAWLALYQKPDESKRLSQEELAYIRSDPPDPPAKVSWLELSRHRATWAFIVGMFFSAPIWWFYLYWVPGFLQDNYGLDLKNIGLPLVAIYIIADIGSVGGGWLSSYLIRKGKSVNAARKTAFLTCILFIVPVFFASQTSELWLVTLLIGLAAAGHQGWSANLFTFVSDTMPRKAVSSVVGMGGFAGSLAGMGFAKLVGYILDLTHSYVVLFAIAPCAYFVALAIIHLLVPRIEPVELKTA